MAAPRPVADLRACLDRLDSDVFQVGPRPEGMSALERLLCLVLQGDGPISSAERAVRALHDRYGNWSEVRVARPFEIREILRKARVADAAGRTELVQEYLRRVFGLQNHLELDWLYDATPERRGKLLNQVTMAPLQAAATLDLDAVEEGDRPPVDKDLKRLLGRLGLVKANPREADVRAIVEPLLEGDELYPNFLKLRALAELGADPRNPQSRAALALQELWDERRGRSLKAFARAAADMGLPLGPKLQKALGAGGDADDKPKRKTAKAKSKKKAAKKTTRKATAKKKPAKKQAKKKAAKKKTAKRKSTRRKA